MSVNVERVLDWKDGLQIWIKPESSFWSFYDRLEGTLAWLSVSLSKYGKRTQVAEEAIKDVLEHPPTQEVDVTVTSKPVEP